MSAPQRPPSEDTGSIPLPPRDNPSGPIDLTRYTPPKRRGPALPTAIALTVFVLAVTAVIISILS